MKYLYLSVSLIFTVLLLPTANYAVEAKSSPTGQDLSSAGLSVAGPVLVEAHELYNRYGSRPFWHLKSFRKGEDVPPEQSADVIAHLISCESQSVSVKHLDSNSKFSFGLTQIQRATWDEWSKQSQITGDPMNPTDAIAMTAWAVQNGYLSRWSCAHILHILSD